MGTLSSSLSFQRIKQTNYSEALTDAEIFSGTGLYPFSTSSSTAAQDTVSTQASSFFGKVDPSTVATSAAHLQMQSMYSRVAGVNPYESWPFNVAGASHIKSEVNGLQTPGSWWDMHTQAGNQVIQVAEHQRVSQVAPNLRPAGPG